MTELALAIRLERPEDGPAIERLHERTFGPGRFARTASRIRERAGSRADLSFTALVGTLLVGAVRVSDADVGDAPVLVLGPLAVDPAFEGRGIGAALMNRALDAARSGGHGLVLLVGDPPYYARFGFGPVPPGQLTMPGPVDPARLLAVALIEGALARASGSITPRRT